MKDYDVTHQGVKPDGGHVVLLTFPCRTQVYGVSAEGYAAAEQAAMRLVYRHGGPRNVPAACGVP